jgi:nucleoside-diphosphate-sugar epimerase
MKTTAAVTGATGFIGRALVARLASSGVSVLALVRDPARAGDLAALPNVELATGDVQNRATLQGLVERAGTVYHLAGLTSARSRAEFMSVNGEATGALAAAAAAAPSPPKIVHVSSLAVAGPRLAADPAREGDVPAPLTAYGESKLLGEQLLRRGAGGGRWTIVRPPWVYGPGDRATLPLFRLAARGFFPNVRGGCMGISLVHVDDLVGALLLAGEAAAADGCVFYVTDGRPRTVAELSRALLAACGGGRAVPVPAAVFRLAGLAGEAAARAVRRPPLLGRDKACEGLQDGWVCDDSRIRRELGYRSRVDLDDGVAGTLAWYRKQGWL